MVHRPHFQTSISLSQLGQSWSYFMCIITGVGERLHNVLGRLGQNSVSMVSMATESLHWLIMGKTMSPPFYAPNFEDWAYWFRVVCPSVRSRTMHARGLKFHIWIPHGKIADPYLFSCPSYLPFWSYAPLKKSEWNLVCKISQSIWARGLKLGQLIGDDE